MKIQDSTIYPSPTLSIQWSILLVVSSNTLHQDWFKWYPLIFTCKFHVVPTLLWSLMTKGEKFGQRYVHLDKDIWYKCTREDEKCKYGHRGSNIEGWRRIKILGQEKHTSRGSKLMNLVVCIWYVHIHVLACICISFYILYAMLVWCMLVIELDWWFDN